MSVARNIALVTDPLSAPIALGMSILVSVLETTQKKKTTQQKKTSIHREPSNLSPIHFFLPTLFDLLVFLHRGGMAMTILDWRLTRERDPVVYCRRLGESPVLSIYEVYLTVTLVSPCVYMLAVIEKLLLGIRWCTSYAMSCCKQKSLQWDFLAIDTSRLDSPKQVYL